MAERLRAVLGLGSSLGDGRSNLALGALLLAAAPELEPVAGSRLYWSPPAGGIARGCFLNAALAVDWSGTPLALLALCLDVERRLGRRRGKRWADRTLDVDLLWIEGRSIDAPGLVVPHPRLLERPFARIPLLEVAPGAADPRTGAPLTPGLGSPLVAVGVLPGFPRAAYSLQNGAGCGR